MVRHTGENFIDIEGIAKAAMFTLQPPGELGSKLDAPEADGLVADCDTSFSQEIFNIAMAEIESVVEPDCVGNNVGWESVAFVSVHGPILPKSAS